MTTYTPPAHKIAATLNWETTTLGDLLDLSESTGIPARLLYRVLNQHSRIEAERGRNRLNGGQGHVTVAVDVPVETPARDA